ncbi:hypothetical protein ACJZ2D_015493 [Fusarium nematophilum]
MLAQVHVVSKYDHTNHATVDIDLHPPKLAGSSVRICTRLIGLTKNNVTYAQGGGRLGWWDAFPVPSTLPAPYNNSEDWCIVPAWGYAEVIDSTTDIPKGSFLFGFWPISAYQHDLKLESWEPKTPGHYREVSTHRQSMMNLYNRYISVDSLPPGDIAGWVAAMFAACGSGYLLSRFSFPLDLEHSAPMHPFGSGTWTKYDADLTSTVIVGLAGSSKTGRSFSWNLRQRQGQGNLPLGYLNASSRALADSENNAAFLTKAVDYEGLGEQETNDWIGDMNPRRVLIVDFGAREGVIQTFFSSVSAALPRSVGFTLIAVGTRHEVMVDPTLPALMMKGQKLERVQCNHSVLQDCAMKAVGTASVYDEWNLAFQQWLSDEGENTMKLVHGSGIKTQTGGLDIDKAWGDLCAGSVPPQEARIFRFN